MAAQPNSRAARSSTVYCNPSPRPIASGFCENPYPSSICRRERAWQFRRFASFSFPGNSRTIGLSKLPWPQRR